MSRSIFVSVYRAQTQLILFPLGEFTSDTNNTSEPSDLHVFHLFPGSPYRGDTSTTKTFFFHVKTLLLIETCQTSWLLELLAHCEHISAEGMGRIQECTGMEKILGRMLPDKCY